MILGVTGLIGSGKGVLGEYLKSKGLKKISFSDVLREECKQKGIEITRESLTKMANEFREKGTNALAKKVIEKISDETVLIDGFRHPDEVLEFRKRGDFFLVAIHSDQKKRFERIKERNRESDPKTFEEFKILDEKEFDSKTNHGIQIGKCINFADYFLTNDSTLFEFYSKIDGLIEHVGTKRLL